MNKPRISSARHFLLLALLVCTPQLACAQQNQWLSNVPNEIEKLLALPIGMEQQEFRYSMPKGWALSPQMSSLKQNRNLAGDYDEGFFQYELNPIGAEQPLFRLYFFASKLTSASALLLIESDADNEQLLQVADRVKAILSNKLGTPTRFDEHEGGFVADWSGGDTKGTLSAYPKKPGDRNSVGQIEVSLKSQSRAADLDRFMAKRSDVVHTGKFVTVVLCQKRLGTNRLLEIGLVTDTRHLSKQAANEVLFSKKEAMEKSGYKCTAQLTDIESDVELYASALAGRRIMKTYLRLVDRDDLVNVITFVNASGQTEEKLCELFLGEIKPTAKSARCITGTGIIPSK